MPVREEIRKNCLLELLSTSYHLLPHSPHMLLPHKKVNRILLDPHSPAGEALQNMDPSRRGVRRAHEGCTLQGTPAIIIHVKFLGEYETISSKWDEDSINLPARHERTGDTLIADIGS